MKLVNLLDAGIEVGDQLYNFLLDEFMEVVSISNCSTYAIKAISASGAETSTTVEGLRSKDDRLPMLMLDRPKIEIPTKKPEPDWGDVFVRDEPVMVRDSGEKWHLAYACCYLPCAEDFKFVAFDGRRTSKTAVHITGWSYGRKLKTEERKLLAEGKLK